jgi:tape measure domain-containing protein
MADAVNLGTIYGNVELRLQRMRDGAEAAKREYKGLRDYLERNSRDLAASMERAGRSMTLGLSLPIAGVGVAALKAATDMDRLTRGLTVVAGSSKEAERQLVRLREVARAPGIGFEEAIEGSIRLQAVGMSAVTAERALKGFANAIATVGGSKQDLREVTVQLTQMLGAGKLQGDEIRVMSERIPQLRRVLKEVFGTASTEEINKLGLSVTEMTQRIVGGLEKLPRASMSAQTAFDNLADTAKQSMAAIGEPILATAASLAERLEPAIKAAGDQFRAMPTFAKEALVGTGGLVALAGVATLALGTLAGSLANIVKLLREVMSLVATSSLARLLGGAGAAGAGGAAAGRLGGLIGRLGGALPAVAIAGGAVLGRPGRALGLWGLGINEAHIKAGEAAERQSVKLWEQARQRHGGPRPSAPAAVMPPAGPDFGVGSRLIRRAAQIREALADLGSSEPELRRAFRLTSELKDLETKLAQVLPGIDPTWFRAQARTAKGAGAAGGPMEGAGGGLGGVVALLDHMAAWRADQSDRTLRNAAFGWPLSVGSPGLGGLMGALGQEADVARLADEWDRFGQAVGGVADYMGKLMTVSRAFAGIMPTAEEPRGGFSFEGLLRTAEGAMRPGINANMLPGVGQRVAESFAAWGKGLAESLSATFTSLQSIGPKVRLQSERFGWVREWGAAMADTMYEAWSERLQSVFGRNPMGKAVTRVLERYMDTLITDALTSAFGDSEGKGKSEKGFWGSMLQIGAMSILGSVLGFAEGGVAPAHRWSLVGERGPELIYPGQPTRVAPLAAAGAGGMNVTVNLNGLSVSSQMDVARLGDALGRRIAQYGRARGRS